MSDWWWLPLGVAAAAAAALAGLARRLEREAAAMDRASTRLRRAAGLPLRPGERRGK